MNLLRISARVIIGLVFIFSGTVKAIDPLGSAYKFHDYLTAFNIGFLDFLSLPLAILLCLAEFLAGFFVLTGIRQKTGTWMAMLLMLGFTPLTLVLALTNPVSDCGCFGDAIHLTNWETFAKNVVLLALAIILFTGRKNTRTVFPKRTEWVAAGIATVVFLLFAAYNLIFLPVIDFLPYSVGTRISEKMKIPEGMPTDVYESTFIYEKDGVRKEFSLTDYPANDTTWVFVDQKSVLVSKGYEPPIHDFSISMNGDDITESILQDKGYTLLMISRKLEDAKRSLLSEGFGTGRYCSSKNIGFYILTASSSDETRKFGNILPFCSADETTLKTMVRANPGYILLHDGVIEGKWSWANLPDKKWSDGKTTGN